MGLQTCAKKLIKHGVINTGVGFGIRWIRSSEIITGPPRSGDFKKYGFRITAYALSELEKTIANILYGARKMAVRDAHRTAQSEGRESRKEEMLETFMSNLLAIAERIGVLHLHLEVDQLTEREKKKIRRGRYLDVDQVLSVVDQLISELQPRPSARKRTSCRGWIDRLRRWIRN